MNSSIKSFTIIELLIMLGVISILSAIAVVVLKPAELLKQGRDSTRIQDIRSIDKAISLGRAVDPSLLDNTSSSIVYVSLPDTDSDTLCNEYSSLPSLETPWEYRCLASSTALHNVDGIGWIPIDFTVIAGGSNISTLPIDPKNEESGNRYYTYSLISSDTFSLSGTLESQKYLNQIAVKDGGNSTSSFETSPITWTTTASAFIESGEVQVSDSLSWQQINLSDSYSSTPVVLATPVTDNNRISQGEGYYPIPLVRNVTTTSFEISMCVDGGATTCTTSASAETFHYFVFNVDYAANYDWIEAGTTANVATDGTYTTETYSTSFVNIPDVWTQAQIYSQGNEIGAVAWVYNKSTTGFNYVGCVHTGIDNTCDTDNPAETFGYVAIDTANEDFPGNVNFQSGMTAIGNSTWTAATFSPTYTNARVMVTQNDDNGAQDPQYAWARNVTGSGMDFRYCEEDAGNVCDTHTDENVYWFAVEQ